MFWEKGRKHLAMAAISGVRPLCGLCPDQAVPAAPCQTMPVRPGRNLAIIIEVAARNLSMKKLGFSAARELDRRMNEMIMKRSNPDAQNQG